VAIDLNKLGIRVLPAIFFVPPFIWMVKFLSIHVFFVFVMIVMSLGSREFKKMMQGIEGDFYWFPSFVTMAALLTSAYYGVFPAGDIFSLGFVLILLYGLMVKTNTENGMRSAGLSLLGTFYLAVPLSYQLRLKHIDSHGADLLLMLYIVIWLGDSAAYLFGSMFGKHRLAPNVSPKKSVEGAVFNILFAVIGAVGYSHFWLKDLSLTHGIIIGLIVGISGMLGDLVESLWKRCASIKDSADLIPGHGGILDRIDSLVLSSPLLYIYYVNIVL
jgi:phosphatidate cytidylyltransferase